MKSSERKHKITQREIFNFLLIFLGAITLGLYYSWWLKDDHWKSVGLLICLVFAVLYGGIQILGNWLMYLATYRRLARSPKPDKNLTVDVFITACGEEKRLIERAVRGVLNMHGHHRTWLLDDGRDPALAEMAAQLGVGYLTRNDRTDAKAGNINAALAKTNGEVVVIFDIDHVPTPDFLQKTLGHFNFPRVGFVQVMLNFDNREDGWVAQAAADTSLDFYNPTSIGLDGVRSATLIGSNALIRRKALEEIGGYQPGLAEDLATSIALHAADWTSVYVPEPLAPGMAPPDLVAWFTQQLKWARGVFELLLTAYPRHFFSLKRGQQLAYALRMTYYWIGPVAAIHLLLTLWALIVQGEALDKFEEYLLHLLPLASVMVGIRVLAMRIWRHRSVQSSVQVNPFALVFASWPVYTAAWLMALLRIPLSFRPTPKTASGSLNPMWIVPQVVTAVILGTGILSTLINYSPLNYPFTLGFAVAQLYSQWILLRQWWVTVRTPQLQPLLPLKNGNKSI